MLRRSGGILNSWLVSACIDHCEDRCRLRLQRGAGGVRNTKYCTGGAKTGCGLPKAADVRKWNNWAVVLASPTESSRGPEQTGGAIPTTSAPPLISPDSRRG